MCSKKDECEYWSPWNGCTAPGLCDMDTNEVYTGLKCPVCGKIFSWDRKGKNVCPGCNEDLSIHQLI